MSLLLAAAIPGYATWPQWRGPDGLGVSTEQLALPERWGPESPNIRWRTPVPGEGISSPIVSRGRVFVTTAYEGSQNELLRALFRGASTILGLALLLPIFRRWRVPLAPPTDSPRARRWLARWDERIVIGASLVFVLATILLAVDPELFFTLGNPGRAWRAGGGIALLGLAAAFGWLAQRSTQRLLGAALVFTGAFLLLYLMPSGPLGADRLSKGLPFVALGAAIACWYVLSFWQSRLGDIPPPRRGSPMIVVSIILLSFLAFASANFLTGLQRVVVSLDLTTGKILWARPVFSGPPEQKWPNSSYATPTPASDGEHVFSYFGHGLASVDFDGRLEWSEMFPRYSRSTRYGAGASPIVAADSVILVQEKEAHQDAPPSWIAAFDKSSGEPLWRVEPPEAHDSYTTPLVLETASGTAFLTASWHTLAAYDAASGKLLWSFSYPMEQMVASMARAGATLAVTGGVYGERTLLVMRLDPEEIDQEVEVLWQTKRSVATIASPVFYGGLLFTLTTPGIMTCYEAETGKVLWRERLDGEYFASLVAGDGKIYAVSTEGSTSVVAAEPRFRLLAVNHLGDRVFASPAIADGCLLIRTAKNLFCIDGQSGRPAAAASPAREAASG